MTCMFIIKLESLRRKFCRFVRIIKNISIVIVNNGIVIRFFKSIKQKQELDTKIAAAAIERAAATLVVIFKNKQQ